MKNKLYQLQDLRGLAILLVVLFHANGGTYNILTKASNGVSLFFIVSGFIISFIHANDRGFSPFIKFSLKRVIRIYTPYIPIFLIFCVLFWISGKGSDYHRNVVEILRNLLLVQNPVNSIHPYAWTLVFEMYYYISFGVVIILLKRSVHFYCVVMSIPPLISYLFFNLYCSEKNLFFSTLNFYFIYGVYFSFLYQKFNFKSNLIMLVFSLLFFLILPFFTENKIFIFISAAFLFSNYLCQNYSNFFLRFIGNTSYSIYLVHALVIVGLRGFLKISYLEVLILTFLSIFLGVLYFNYIEKKWTNRISKLIQR